MLYNQNEHFFYSNQQIYKKITILISIESSLKYGGDRRALFGTAKPEFVFRNSCDIKSLVGVTWK